MFPSIFALALSYLPAPPPTAAAVAEPLPPGALVRLGSTKFWHWGPIGWVGFSADGATALTVGVGGLHFWNMATGKEVASQETYASPRGAFAFSTDRRKLFVANHDKTTLTDVVTRKVIRSFDSEMVFGPHDEHQYVDRFILSPDGRFLALWDDAFHSGYSWGDGKKRKAPFLHLWDLDTGRRLHDWKPGDIYEAEFSPDGKMLIAQEKTKDGKSSLCFRDVLSGKALRRAELPRGLMRFAFLPDGATFVGLNAQSNALHHYDTATGKELAVLVDNQKPILSFALSSDGERLAFVQPGKVIVQQIGGEKVRAWPISMAQSTSDNSMPEWLAFSADGKTLAVADSRRLALWDIDTGSGRHPTEAFFGSPVAIHVHGPHLLARDGDLSLSLWDRRTGKLQRRFQREAATPPDENPPRYFLHDLGDCGVAMQAISPDGTKVAVLWPNAPIQLFDLTRDTPLLRFEGTGTGLCLAFSGDGKLLAAPTADGKIGAWNTTTGKQVRRFGFDSDADVGRNQNVFVGLRFASDGRSLLATVVWPNQFNGRPNTTWTWECATGSVRRYKNNNEQGMLTFAPPPGRGQIATLGPHSICVVDTLSGKEVCRFGGAGIVGTSAAFSPDGKLLAIGLENGGIRFWNVGTGRVLGDAPAHKAAITSLAFADHKTLVSAGQDGVVIAWELPRLIAAASAEQSELPDAELQKLWLALGDGDAEKAVAAMGAFAARPGAAVVFFQRRLQPAPIVSPQKIAQWVADLRNDRYAVRQKAAASLEQLEGQARIALEKGGRDSDTLEARRRIEALLQKLEPPVTAPELLRGIRAIEVLERIGTPQARGLLETLAAGGPGHRLTEDARDALERLAKRP